MASTKAKTLAGDAHSALTTRETQAPPHRKFRELVMDGSVKELSYAAARKVLKAFKA